MLGKRKIDELEFHETEFDLVLTAEEDGPIPCTELQKGNNVEEKSSRSLRNKIMQHSDFNESLEDLMASSRKQMSRIERDKLDSNYINQNFDPDRAKSIKKPSFQPEMASLDEMLQNSKKKYFGIELEKKEKACPSSQAKNKQPAEKEYGLFEGDLNVVFSNAKPSAARNQTEQLQTANKDLESGKKLTTCDKRNTNTDFVTLEEALSNKKYSQLELQKQNPDIKLMYSRVDRTKVGSQTIDKSPIKLGGEAGSLEDLMKNSLKKTTRMTQEKEMAARCQKMEGNQVLGGKSEVTIRRPDSEVQCGAAARQGGLPDSGGQV